MKSEREEFNKANGSYSNGYRSRIAFGDKQMLELQIPHTRNGGFFPVILGLLIKESRRRNS